MSLVCDFQELYRYLIDDFLIQYSQRISKKDFVTKTENANRKRKGKREYLSDLETRELLRELDKFFETRIKLSRIRNGENQTIETLINEEALLLAKYLRNERKNWDPRITKIICQKFLFKKQSPTILSNDNIARAINVDLQSRSPLSCSVIPVRL